MSRDWAVFGFPALGRFEDEGAAIAAAWTVTKAGDARPAVGKAQTRVQDWNSPARIDVSPVEHRMDPTHADDPVVVRSVTVTLPAEIAERATSGIAPAEAKRKLFDLVVKAASDTLYDDADLDEYEDLSIGVTTIGRRDNVILFEAEAVVINAPRMMR